MKKVLLLLSAVVFYSGLFAQDSTAVVKKKPIDLSNRSNDHLLIQLGYTGWANRPDSIKPSGISKSINIYFMFDFPFKTNPKLSMAFGPGIATDHIIFKKTHVGIADNANTIPFTDLSDTNHFKKTKLATAYFELPIEFRFSSNPLKTSKSLKFAVGVKVGTMLNAHTRNTKWENKSGSLLKSFLMKESDKKYFNKNRLVATARFGLGHFSLFGNYQLTSLFKDGLGPQVKPFSIGLTISGL